DIGKATIWFPFVGALLGAIQVFAAAILVAHLPPLVAAVLVVALGALLTGALHLDGLADTADGFGGGRTRADVLRILRDHAVGAYGVVAVALVLALKIAVLAALVASTRGHCSADGVGAAVGADEHAWMLGSTPGLYVPAWSWTWRDGLMLNRYTTLGALVV